MQKHHEKQQVIGVHELLLLLFMVIFYGLPVYVAFLVQVCY